MKAQYSLIVFLLVTFIACKQTPKTDTEAEQVGEAITSSKPEKKETTQSKEKTIEEFLQQLQTAVMNDDVATIEKNLKFPIEFNWGGESSFYNTYKEVKENNDMFSYILEAESIEKDGNMFIITYQDPEDIEYFVSFIVVKEGDSFKLTTFMQPH
ncbi:hypothetical protein ACSTS3_15095 [Aquimarina muelleri]|uniref:hypothetical protein n=1 Tax=Aquimarina muelleri TaxID=279356 RepID=UPI003F688DDD